MDEQFNMIILRFTIRQEVDKWYRDNQYHQKHDKW